MGPVVIDEAQRTSGHFFGNEMGRQAGASPVTLTSNEILAALSSAERSRLAIALVDGDVVKDAIHVQGFDFGQPGLARSLRRGPWTCAHVGVEPGW